MERGTLLTKLDASWLPDLDESLIFFLPLRNFGPEAGAGIQAGWPQLHNLRRNKMNEIVNLLQQKTGMSQEMAQQAVQIVVTHLKSRLPAPLAGGLDHLMGGASAAQAEGGGMMSSLENLMGGKES